MLKATTIEIVAILSVFVMLLSTRSSSSYSARLLPKQRKDAVSSGAHATCPNDCERDFDEKRRDGN
jgi:hypothetical protein